MLTSRRTAPEDVHITHASTRLYVLPEDDVLPTEASVRLGARLRAQRKALDWSLIQAAVRVGMPASRVMRLESGRAEETEIARALAGLEQL